MQTLFQTSKLGAGDLATKGVAWVKAHKFAASAGLIALIFFAPFLQQFGSANSSIEDSLFTAEARLVEEQISIVGTLVPADRRLVSSPFDGIVSEVYVAPGDTVKTGDPLLSLNTREIDARLRSAEVARLTAEEKFRALQNWENGQEVVQAKRSLSNAQAVMRRAEKRASETEVLFHKGIIARSELETDQQTVNDQRAALVEAEASLDSVFAQATGQKIRIAYLELENARAAHEELVNLRAHATIVSPINGVVQLAQKKESEAEAKSTTPLLGQKVTLGHALYLIEQSDKLKISADISEFDVTKITVGQEASVEAPGAGDGELTATISRISDQAKQGDYSDAGPKVAIEAALVGWTPEDGSALRVGGNVYMHFTSHLGKDIILVPPNALSFSTEGGTVSVLADNGRFEVRSVEIGRNLEGRIEILSGVNDGEQIRLN